MCNWIVPFVYRQCAGSDDEENGAGMRMPAAVSPRFKCHHLGGHVILLF